MTDILKYVIFGAGCVALYGLATGADLNELFVETQKQVIPVAKQIIAGIWDFVLGVISGNSEK